MGKNDADGGIGRDETFRPDHPTVPRPPTPFCDASASLGGHSLTGAVVPSARDDAIVGLSASCTSARRPAILAAADLSPGTSPPPLAPSRCDAAYPTVCIPTPPPDLDCGGVVFRRFTVLEPDPHRFDGDDDGIGCEGYLELYQ